MQAQLEILQGYVGDMLAVEREIHQAFSRQKHDEHTRKFAAAGQLIGRIEDTVDRHIKELETCLRQIDGEESAVRKAVGAVTGFAGGLFDKLRLNDKVSRMMRDDYTALCFATVCYEMLHTTALAARNHEVAELALSHLKAYAPFIMQMADVIPEVLIDELSSEGKIVADHRVAEDAVRNTHSAWEHSAAH
jgi:hypothetical protein